VLSAGCQAKIFGNARALPHKTTRHSLFAARCRFTIRHSLLAIRYSLPFFFRLADLPISRFADKIRLGRNFALPLSALQKSHPPVANCQLLFATRHSLLQRGWVAKFASGCDNLLAG
jgi:hypothetical protein